MNGKRTLNTGNLVAHVILIMGAVVMLFPVFWVVSTSFKTKAEVNSSQVNLWPAAFTLENYAHVLNLTTTERTRQGGAQTINLFARWGLNSLLAAALTTLVGVLLAATAAYAFSRFRFLGRNAALISFLITQMFPGAILIVPLYNLFNGWGLLNSIPGLVLAYTTIALPFSVWMLKGFFDAIPVDLEEAAMVDGVSPLGAFYRIVLPLTLPGIAVVGFYNFMTAWNEFMLALTFMTGEANKTLPVGLRTFVTQFDADWHFMAAASVLVSIPVMLGFFWAQRYLIAGLTAGGVKG